MRNIQWSELWKQIRKWQNEELYPWLGRIIAILLLGMIIQNSFRAREGQYITGVFWAMWIVLGFASAIILSKENEKLKNKTIALSYPINIPVEITDNISDIKRVESALNKKPKDSKLLGLIGSILETVGNYEQALEEYEKALLYEPNNLANLYNKAFCLERLERYENCVQGFDVLLKYYPNDSKALANKGKILKRMNRLEEGLKCCKQALNHDPDEYTAQYNIAEINKILNGESENFYKNYGKK